MPERINTTELKNIILSVLNKDVEIDLDQNLLEFGLGSLQVMRIAGQLRKKKLR